MIIYIYIGNNFFLNFTSLLTFYAYLRQKRISVRNPFVLKLLPPILTK